MCKILQLFKEVSSNDRDTNYMAGKSGVLQKFKRFERAVFEHNDLFVGHIAPNITVESKSWLIARGCVMALQCCVICNKTDYDQDLAHPIEWRCCSRCNYGWTCSDHHEEYMTSKHTNEICTNYIQLSKIEFFRYNHTINNGDTFLFMPEQALTTPMRSFPKSWDDYFKTRCSREYSMRRHLPDEYFPASTFLLSQITTILYGMYLQDKDYFTSRDREELTIHILGPSHNFEYEGGAPTCIWEEIMHCLPAVKTLKVIFVGPEGKLNNPLCPIEACPDCVSKGRVRMQGFYDTTYHDYHASNDFIKPDFVAAFNTGMYDEYTESWKESLRVLLSLDVPCIFTSYNELEGGADLKVLQEVGANTLTDETMLNPFQVKIPKIDDNFLDKFFYDNMYYVCFRGRKN